MAHSDLKLVDTTSESDATLTVEQLAAESGMTVRNIRSHQARGLLPPPEVRQRIGYYGPEHVSRLRLIRDLQAEGFNLRGIKRLLEETPGPAEQLLDFKRIVTAPFETEEPQIFTAAELQERFGAEASGRSLSRAVKLGVLVPIGRDRFEAPSPSLLDAAEEVMRGGVTLRAALAVVGAVQRSCEAVASSFVRLFLEGVWEPFEEAGYPEERWEEVLGSIQRLRPIASQVVLAVFQQTMTQHVETAFGRQLHRLSEGRQ